MRTKGKVAIVTGAASGIGEAIAELLYQQGAKVVATDINSQLLEKSLMTLDRKGESPVSIQLDVSSEKDWQHVVKETLRLYGRIDILVNNAGVLSKHKGIHKVDLDEWNDTMNVNATGVYLGMKYVIKQMIQGGGGTIVNISSIASVVGSSSSSAYTASKGAVSALTKNAAIDYAKYKIRVNSVHPGFIRTPILEKQLKDKERNLFIKESTPLPYLGKPKDIAYGVLYLASDESRFVTGTELVIDGGYVIK